jgi:hypothetical protein
MSDFEIDALVRELESLGVAFRVVPRMDGSLRLSCWRTQKAWPNRHRINHLIAERIDSSPEVSALIAELIGGRSTQAADSDQSRVTPDPDEQP